MSKSWSDIWRWSSSGSVKRTMAPSPMLSLLIERSVNQAWEYFVRVESTGLSESVRIGSSTADRAEAVHGLAL